MTTLLKDREQRLLRCSDEIKHLASTLRPAVTIHARLATYGDPFRARYTGMDDDGRLFGGERATVDDEESNRLKRIDAFLDAFEGNSATLRPKAHDYPKWVEPHESHLVKQPDGSVGAPGHEFHTARDGTTTVLVADEDAEKEATSEKGTPNPPAPERPKSIAELDAERERAERFRAAAAADPQTAAADNAGSL